jgi:hypothetical protein
MFLTIAGIHAGLLLPDSSVTMHARQNSACSATKFLAQHSICHFPILKTSSWPECLDRLGCHGRRNKKAYGCLSLVAEIVLTSTPPQPASKASDRSPLHHCPTGASSSNTQPRIQEDDPIKVILTDEERANRVEKSKDASIGKGLWTEARSRLDPDRLVQLGKHIDEDNKGLQKAAKAKLEAIRSSRLKIKIGQNKELVVRDGVTKVIKTIFSYSDLISAAVAAEPHASLAWGGVAALLPVSPQDLQASCVSSNIE